MTVEEAIVTALSHERSVRDHYRESGEAAADPEARAFFALLAEEEQGHVDYLEAKLARWRREGTIGEPALGTVCPHREWVHKGLADLKQAASPRRPDQGNLERLHVALRLEEAVSDFYRGLVSSMTDEAARTLFHRFLEIEDGHTAVVRAEIDYLSHTGCFFDVQEFTLDG
jgi:rubrerythrin